MLAIQEYISSFDDIDQALFWLKRKLGVLGIEQSLAGRQLIQFSSAVGSEDLISRESNGLILNMAGEVVCRLPLRPIRIKETDYSKIEWKGASVIEREEGLKVMIFYLNDMWNIATIRSAEGLENIKIEPNITSTVRFEIAHKLNTDFGTYNVVFDHLDNENLCFIFNYSWPLLDCLNPPKKPHLVLETAIDRVSGIEMDSFNLDEFAEVFGFQRPSEKTFTSEEDVKLLPKIVHIFSPGLDIQDTKGQKYFYPNRLYTALHIAKISGVNLLPVHVLNILTSCRNNMDTTIIAGRYKKMSPIIDLLNDARSSLVVQTAAALSGCVNTDKPAAVVKMEAYLLELIKKNLKSTTPCSGECIVAAINKLRPDKVIAYVAATEGQKYFSAVEKLRED
jgi:hypothetical protein